MLEWLRSVLRRAGLKLEDLLILVEAALFSGVLSDAFDKLSEKLDAVLVLYRDNVYRDFVLHTAKTFREQVGFAFVDYFVRCLIILLKVILFIAHIFDLWGDQSDVVVHELFDVVEDLVRNVICGRPRNRDLVRTIHANTDELHNFRIVVFEIVPHRVNDGAYHKHEDSSFELVLFALDDFRDYDVTEDGAETTVILLLHASHLHCHLNIMKKKVKSRRKREREPSGSLV
jgi:hypothetical protein